MTTTKNGNDVTERQINFASSLIDEIVRRDPDNASDWEELRADMAEMTKPQASLWIDTLIKTRDELRAIAATAPTPTVEARTEISEGIWTDGTDVFKVQRAVHGSGKLYAKVLDRTDGRFAYAAGLIGRLRNRDLRPLTVDEAKAHGDLYGMCVYCSRTLTDERSISHGYGPTCASNHGLPWG